MSDLPEGWVWTDAATVTEVQGGIQKQPKRRPVLNRYPFLRVANVMRGHLDLREVHEIELFEGEIERFRLRAGDLLVVEGNGSPDQIGRAALWNGDIQDCVHQNHLIRVRPTAAIDSKYLAYYWNAPQTTQYLRSVASSTSGLHVLTTSKVRSVRVPLAPMAEQLRIVAAIEEQFSRLDAGVSALERARQSLKRMHAAVLETAVRGLLLDGGTADDDDDHGDAPKLLPLGWSNVFVEDVAEVVGGITKNPKRIPRDNAVPFLRVANVMRDRLDLREVHQIEVFAGELQRFRLRRGDLLVVEGNGSADQIGRSALWDGSIDPCVHQNHLIRVRPGSKILPAYLNIFWNAPSSMATIQAAASSTSGLHTLSAGKVRGVRVALPPMEVQHRIVEEVDRQLSALSVLDSQLGIVETRGRSLRAAILAAAFSGNLTSQDPREEPASVLLERITAERAACNEHTSKRGGKPRVLREEVTA